MAVARNHPSPLWQRAMIVLSGTFVGLVVVLGLQWGRPVLIPIALAVLLTFLVNPIVRLLEQRGMGRVFSVLLAVSTAGFLLLGLGWIMTRQVAGLLAELPQNTANIKAKIKTLRELGSGHLADQFATMVDEISQELQRPSHQPFSIPGEDWKRERSATESSAERVQLRTESTFWLNLTGYLGSALEVLGTLAFALVLLVFFLIGRENFRDRVVLLAGKARLALTSKALEDCTDRISRYVVLVAVVNGSFGVLLSAGLFALQVPYALLWGFLAASLRFIPYVGTWIGAIFPIVMSLATFDGWWQPLAVFAYVMVLELTSNNLIEPFLFGRSIGVSPTALLISAATWLFLWGPIGLVLSAPFAVCLVVLGKNIPQLGFLNVLLGDIPALPADMGFYQRLMLGDDHEAVRLVLQHIKSAPSDSVYDDLLIPALTYMRRDIHRNYLTDDDRQTILKGVRESLRAIDQARLTALTQNPEFLEATSNTTDKIIPLALSPASVLGYPAMDETDGVAFEMLRQMINQDHWKSEAVADELSTTEVLAHIRQEPPDIIVIASLSPGGLTHAVYACKRIREIAPTIPIVVGRWGSPPNKLVRERFERAGASFVASTLLETAQLLDRRWPLLTREIRSTPVPTVTSAVGEDGLHLQLQNRSV